MANNDIGSRNLVVHGPTRATLCNVDGRNAETPKIEISINHKLISSQICDIYFQIKVFKASKDNKISFK